MNGQQQKLYDKLLKKVNEYCLGAAAEDVIAAIDALVENYERYLHTPKDPYKVARVLLKDTTPLQAFKEVRDYLDYVFYDKPGTRAMAALSTSQYLEPFVTVVETALIASQLIIDRRCDIRYVGFFTIDSHELAMSEDEIKFVEDVLNESTN